MGARLQLLLLVVAAVVAGCGLGGGQEPVLGARLAEGRDDALVIEFSGCEDSPPILVDETDETVRITLDTPRSGCEPLFQSALELDDPLGDRRVVDGATGTVLVPGGT